MNCSTEHPRDRKPRNQYFIQFLFNQVLLNETQAIQMYSKDSWFLSIRENQFFLKSSQNYDFHQTQPLMIISPVITLSISNEQAIKINCIFLNLDVPFLRKQLHNSNYVIVLLKNPFSLFKLIHFDFFNDFVYQEYKWYYYT